MSKRRESLKESLGLTEYPWSSDEDDDPEPGPGLNPPAPELVVAPDQIPLPPDPPLPPAEPAPTPELLGRQSNSGCPSTSGPSTSGGSNGSPAAGANTLSEMRRSQALFWRLLSHPRRVSSISISASRNGSRPPNDPLSLVTRVSRSASLPSTGRSVRLDPNVHQRILAIRRLNRSGNSWGNRTTQNGEGNSSRDAVFVEDANLHAAVDAAVDAAVAQSYTAYMAERSTRPRHARTAARSTDRPPQSHSTGPPADPRSGPRRRLQETVNVLDSDDADNNMELPRIGDAWPASHAYLVQRGYIRGAGELAMPPSDMMLPLRRTVHNPPRPEQSVPPAEPTEDNEVTDGYIRGTGELAMPPRDDMFSLRRTVHNPLPAPPAEPTEDNDVTDAEETVDVDGPTPPTSANTSALALEEEIVEIDCEPEREPRPSASNQPNRADPLAGSSFIIAPAPEALRSAVDGADTSNGNVEPQPHGTKRKHDATGVEEGEPATVKEFNSNLLRLLECPVCLEWMEPPMCQCRRGHLVCGRCRARLQSCPVCRTAFSSVRNRAMEGVADLVRYPCRHGCGREVKLRRRAPHESSCAARRYRCVMPACADRAAMPHDSLEQHFQNKHLPFVKMGRKHKFSVKVNAELHENWVVMALRQLFHVRIDVDVRTWGVVVYAAYIGPKCFAPSYTYEITVVGQYNSRKLSYTRATHCDLECSTLNVSRQDCFHLTLDQALNFLRIKNRHCEPDELLHFTIEISKLENPQRDDSDS